MDMGEWSDYFEDFPEEAPQPPSAEERAKEKFDSDIKDMNVDAFALIAKTKKKVIDAAQLQKKQFFESIDYCPQCGEKKLNVYKLENKTYLCECQDCGIYGAGDNFSAALHKTASAIGDNIDWRDGSLFSVNTK
jgi:DNA-directed RNA polymerase subunit M/transcription elongation factor TFIIS